MILFEDGRTAQIVGASLVFAVGEALPIANIAISASRSVIDIDVSTLSPPIMYAKMALPDGEALAAMTLANYNQLAVASTMRTTRVNGQVQHRTMLTTSPAAAFGGAIARRFGKCCGQR